MLLIQTEIKFLAAEGVKLTYIHELLLKVHGEAALIMSTIVGRLIKETETGRAVPITNHGVVALAQQ